MIKTENVELNGKTFRHTYSDNDEMFIHKIGTTEIYDEAYDLISSHYKYEEILKPQTETEE